MKAIFLTMKNGPGILRAPSPLLFVVVQPTHSVYQAVLFTRFAPLTLPRPVARSHPGVAPNAGWEELAVVVGLMTAVQVAPLPAPPEMVQVGTPV